VTCVPWDPLEKSTSSTFRIQRAEKWSPEHRTCPVRHPPDPSFEAFAQSVLEAVRSWQYEPPRGGRLAFDLTFGFTPRGEAQLLAHGVSVVEPPPRSGPDWAKPRDMLRMEPEWLRQTIRAGGEVSPPTKLKDFVADYPPIAWSARVQGTVTLDALVGPDGRVQDAYVVRSIPLLDSAAFDAVKQWEFTPPLRKGRPVPVSCR
jgi:TonB family protein